MNPTPTPKERFLKSKSLVGAHRDITGHADFDAVIDAAMLEFSNQLWKAPATEAGAHYFKLVGAQDFVRVLRTLSLQDSGPVVYREGNLNHKV